VNGDGVPDTPAIVIGLNVAGDALSASLGEEHPSILTGQAEPALLDIPSISSQKEKYGIAPGGARFRMRLPSPLRC